MQEPHGEGDGEQAADQDTDSRAEARFRSGKEAAATTPALHADPLVAAVQAFLGRTNKKSFSHVSKPPIAINAQAAVSSVRCALLDGAQPSLLD